MSEFEVMKEVDARIFGDGLQSVFSESDPRLLSLLIKGMQKRGFLKKAALLESALHKFNYPLLLRFESDEAENAYCLKMHQCGEEFAEREDGWLNEVNDQYYDIRDEYLED